MSITIDDIMNMLDTYSDFEKDKILHAYEFASIAHNGQFRDSGEPYITHPLNVAKMVISWNADADTICAALLHDTIEDSNVTYDDIAINFGNTVATLVDGVTKMSGFSNRKERDLANTRKIISSITKDIRIIIIKLADRLHNMSTIDYKCDDKKKENAFETLRIYAPVAKTIGFYNAKSELEDLSFKCLEPDIYNRLLDKRENFLIAHDSLLKEIIEEISQIMNDNNFPCEIKQRVRNIYSIYRRINEGHSFESIQDLLSIKIILDDIVSCHASVHFIHSRYDPVNSGWRDYISKPNINKYRALHTIVMVKDNIPLQAQIKTPSMDLTDDYGICSYWTLYGHNGYTKMQKDLKREYPFYKKLEKFDKEYKDDEEYLYHVKSELLSPKIFVSNSLGFVVELPYGSTVEKYLSDQEINIEEIDFCTVNGERVSFNHILSSGDVVFVRKKCPQLLLEK